jgi:triacylglycerol esterase/lipase EstA (alpha/beta hydrolase family)
MSPTRPAAAVAALLTALAVSGCGSPGAGSAGATGQQHSPRQSTPVPSSSVQEPEVDHVPQSRPGPVLLVPGYGGDSDALSDLAARLRAAGRTVTVVSLPDDGRGDLAASAETLDVAARAATATAKAPSIDIVGYSAGGVIARLWVSAYGGDLVTRRVVTLGSPHHGSGIAAMAARFIPQDCPEACRQLVPTSGLLRSLNTGDETPPGPRWVSLWTKNDEVVTPATSASLSGAVNIPLQSVCSHRTVRHSDLPRDDAVRGVVLLALGRAPLAAPPSDCAAITALGHLA